jgi:Ni,Fe-hydrogenase III small subunit
VFDLLGSTSSPAAVPSVKSMSWYLVGGGTRCIKVEYSVPIDVSVSGPIPRPSNLIMPTAARAPALGVPALIVPVL